MNDQTHCLIYLLTVFIASTLVVMRIFKRIKPEAYANVQNNENAWFVAIMAIIVIMIVAGEIGNVVFKWCPT